MKLKYKLPFVSGLIVLAVLVASNSFIAISLDTLMEHSTDNKRKILLEQKEKELVERVRLAEEFLTENHRKTNSAESILANYGINIRNLSSEDQGVVRNKILNVALNNIARLENGHGKYIWIIEAKAPFKFILNPEKPELVGFSVEHYIYRNGRKNLYELYLEQLNEMESAIVSYDDKILGKEETLPRMSYVKRFKTNDWIIGSNLDLAQVDKEANVFRAQQRKLNRNLLIISILLSIVMLAGAIISLFRVVNVLTTSITQIMVILKKMARGERVYVLNLSDKNEISSIQESVNTLISSNKKYSDFAIELRDGNLDARFQAQSKDDVLGTALLSMREGFKEAAEEENKRRDDSFRRNWTSDGIDLISSVLRKNTDNLEDLSFNVISKLTKYVKAGMGVLYMLKDENPEDVHLELLAAYAMEKRRLIEQRYELKEGLPGTCAQEKATLLITEVPDDYAKITSALGNASPNTILLVPMKLEDKVLGIIELGSFNQFKDYEIKFIETVTQNIALAISNVIVSRQTRDLLRQTEQQAKLLAERNKLTDPETDYDE